LLDSQEKWHSYSFHHSPFSRSIVDYDYFSSTASERLWDYD
jgi:hypothetical protein